MNKLKFFRELNNLSQQEVAEKLFINQNTYSRYENEPLKTPEEVFEQLSVLYKVPKENLQSDDPFIIITNNGSSYGSYFQTTNNNYPKEIVDKLIAAKDEIIKAKDELIAQLRKGMKY